MRMTRSKSKAMKIVSESNSHSQNLININSESDNEVDNEDTESDTKFTDNTNDTDISDISDSDSDMDQDFNPDTDKFLDLVDTIYTGEFFESTSQLNPDKNVKELSNQLIHLKREYCKNNINIVDILQMDLPDQTKHKIFESLYQLENI
jgi:hypothetical protein